MADKSGAHNWRWYASGVLQVLVAPFLAYKLVETVTGHAFLVGPYLLVSPMIAMLVVALFMRRSFDPQEKKGLEAGGQLQELADWYANELGTPKVSVEFFSRPESGYCLAISNSAGSVHIVKELWEEIPRSQQEFALADVMAFRSVAKVQTGLRWLSPVLLFAACCVASINLWAIIPLHTIGLSYIVWWPSRLMRRQTLAADRLALSLTRNLTAARDYLQQHKPDYAAPWLKLDARLEALNLAAAELGMS